MRSMKHLVIIDGHHLMYRAYWAIPRTMRTNAGEQTNAAFGFASMLLQIIRTEQPDSLLFCFDKGDQTFRHKEFGEYKGGRADTPDDFYTQIPRMFEIVEAFGLKAVSDEQFEADDFACAYARMAEKEGYRVTIVSGDRDLLQIVSENIRVAIPHKAYQMPEYFTPDKVVEKFGIRPDQVPSYKGLVGDSSDNYKGVPGIGPIAASALIQEYGTIESIYDHLADIKPGWRKKLEPAREAAFFCERMALLRCDIPCPLSLDDLLVAPFSADTILALFAILEFHILTRRLKTFLESEQGRKYASAETLDNLKQKTSEENDRKSRQTGQHESSQLSLL